MVVDEAAKVAAVVVDGTLSVVDLGRNRAMWMWAIKPSGRFSAPVLCVEVYSLRHVARAECVVKR